MPEAYVYAHRKSTDDSVFYIGKGRGYRLNQKTSRNPHWHNIVNKHGFYSEILMNDLTDAEAFELEMFLISEIDGLCNLTLGGDGHLGLPSWNKGKKLSENHRKAISESKKGRVTFSEESKKKMSDAKKGIKQTEEHRRRIAESLRKHHQNRKIWQKQ